MHSTQASEQDIEGDHDHDTSMFNCSVSGEVMNEMEGLEEESLRDQDETCFGTVSYITLAWGEQQRHPC